MGSESTYGPGSISTAEADQYALVCDNVSKKFTGTWAVHPTDLRVRRGTIHSVVGENGAGKSTLLGLMSGRLTSDTGAVTFDGTPVAGGNPRRLRELGLVAVYQELTMIPALSAEANLFLGAPVHRFGLMDKREMRRRYQQISDEFGVWIPPTSLARDLSVSQQQMLEIMRGVLAGGSVLLLDEPSAALAENERAVLYNVLTRLREQGKTLILVSHNLDEVLSLSDEITVLRDGRLVKTAPRIEWNRESLISAMIGRITNVASRRDVPPIGELAVQVEGLNMPGVLHDVDISVHKREIVGLWGLVGSGRTTIMRSIFGLERQSSGRLRVGDKEIPWPKSSNHAIRRGIVMLPESRKQGLVLNMDGVQNYWLGRTYRRSWWLRRRAERSAASDTARQFGFDVNRIGKPVGTLSGGNQQKILLSKWAGHKPGLFLIDEPTRGIDIGAKSEVLDSLVRLASDGACIVVTSSELEEVLAVAHRILVIADGRVVGEISADSPDFRTERIVSLGFKVEESVT